MKIDPTHELARWLAAERDDDAERAEAALAAVFAALPAAVPPLGFAARVVAVSCAGAVPAPAAGKGALATPWARLLLTVALVWVGLAA
ncbi:MAG TPA: hypothetical protein VF121_10630, partial [Thermoanaerobaculia bacterium]|nr:hypothetical protein [Thermoanaerobaculia bacterium]